MSHHETKQISRRTSMLVRSAQVLLGAALAVCARAADIERPKIQFLDKFGVNMANGQVTHSLDTVSIGGATGLSHNVSVFANEFNYPGMRGFADKFYAVARHVQICTSPADCDPMTVMRVHDWSDTQSFAYGGPTGYTPISDERHSLEVSGSEFLWTKADGTVVRFDRGGTGLPATAGGTLTSVEYLCRASYLSDVRLQ